MSEAAIAFPCAADVLLGILHSPDTNAQELGILIVVGGPQYRVGSHRQFVLMARKFAEVGYPVFRFDYRGMGDSTGEPRTFEAVDDDIRAAVDAFMAAMPGLRGVVIFGLCDAASAAWMYCSQDARLAGLILANPWVRTEAGAAKSLVRHYYLQRLLQRSFWTSALAGGLHPIASIRGALAALRLARSGTTGSGLVDDSSFLARMKRGATAFAQPVLVLMSEQDLTAREFEDLVRDSGEWAELMARPNVRLNAVQKADHTFSGRQALEQATHIAHHWLTITFIQ